MSKFAQDPNEPSSGIEGCLDLIRQETKHLTGMPEFYDTVVDLMKLHASKNADYTGKSPNPLFNFQWTAGFNGTNMKAAFRHHIGNKISRLMALDSVDEKANNESVEDTLRDLAVYIILEIAARKCLGEAFFIPVDSPSCVFNTRGAI